MTPQQRFEHELGLRLRERARLLLTGQQQVLAALAGARAGLLQTLAALPSDWQQWHLSCLLGQIEDMLRGATGQAAGVLDGALRSAWQMGEDVVDKPLAAGGFAVELQLPQLDVRVLAQMRSFAALRLKDVGEEAARAIGRQLGLVTLGGVTPFEAMRQVQRILGGQAAQRAATIVRTEVSRAYAIASRQRLEQAAPLVPGLQKQWRRSGKPKSRWNHDLMDGQVVDADKPFKVPNPGGGVDLMMHPHDPKAPPEQVISCGCLCLPYVSGWQVMTPGAKPFSALELQREPGKAQMDRQAKAAGLRPEPLPGAHKAVVPPAKLVSYALNPDHPRGGHKARVIASMLGYTIEHANAFEAAIREGLARSVAEAPQYTGYGTKYQVDMRLTGPKGSGTLRTGWMVDMGADTPRLTSAYMKPNKP